MATAILHPDITENNLFSFSDQDDVWHSDKLIKANSAIEIFDQQLPVLYGGRTRLVNADLEHVGYSPLFKRLPSFKNVCYLLYIFPVCARSNNLWLLGVQFSVSLELSIIGEIIVTILVTCLLSRFVLKHLLNESYVQ